MGLILYNQLNRNIAARVIINGCCINVKYLTIYNHLR